MVVNTTLNATQATAGTIPALSTIPYVGASHQTTNATSKVSGTVNATTMVYTQYTHEFVDASGTVLTPSSAAYNYVRYAEYPGEALFSKVRFEVNGNPLDDYDSTAYFFHRKYRVLPHKIVAWQRLVGQEVPREAYSNLVSINGASNYPATGVTGGAALVGVVDQSGAIAQGAPVNASYTMRKFLTVGYGPQTPQLNQPALDIWQPLIFWFNKDSRLSIASVSIPYGQIRLLRVSAKSDASLAKITKQNYQIDRELP